MRLPPLNALRAFEAAARHGGYVGASEELHVTRGAISRQVKLLEEHLNTQLFRRHGKGVDLTEAGKRLLPVLTEAFGRILDESRRISSDVSDLRVICPPATSIRWLIPRLDDFHQKHPEIRIRLTTDFMRGSTFDAYEYDLGFSCSNFPNRPKNLNVQDLFPIYLTPACAPALLDEDGALPPVEALTKFALLHETAEHTDWRVWLDSFGIKGVDAGSGHEFTNLDMATKAAVMGAGIVMADLIFNRDELNAGALTRLFPDKTCQSPQGHICLVGPKDRWDNPKIKTFRDWVAQAAQEETADPLFPLPDRITLFGEGARAL